MIQRSTDEIINEVMDIAQSNMSLYRTMMDYAETVFFDDKAYRKAQQICTAAKSDIYRSLRIVGVGHEEAVQTVESAIINNSSLRAELKSDISF